MPPPRRCFEAIAAPIFRKGSRPSGCPRPMRRGWLRRNRLSRTLRHFHRRRRGFCFVPSSPPFLWWSLGAEALGTQRDDRPKGIQILRRAASVSYQDDHRETAKLNGKQRENLGEKERDPLQLGGASHPARMPCRWGCLS